VRHGALQELCWRPSLYHAALLRHCNSPRTQETTADGHKIKGRDSTTFTFAELSKLSRALPTIHKAFDPLHKQIFIRMSRQVHGCKKTKRSRELLKNSSKNLIVMQLAAHKAVEGLVRERRSFMSTCPLCCRLFTLLVNFRESIACITQMQGEQRA
jgi:hypothetical protein